MFGDVLREHRRRSGLTQEELAAKAGMSGRHVRHLEAGRIGCPRPATVRLLADALGLDGPDRDRFVGSAVAGDQPVPGGTGGRPVPAQLPLDVYGFSGRQAEIELLDAVLGGVEGQPKAVVVSAVSGTAGVGKTALAVHWAHRVADRFPDGQLYVKLRGFDPAGSVLDPADALRGFLDALGVAPQAIPTELDAQAGLYRSLLAGRRMLIVLDNARDSDQVRPLLPGAAGCLVLVTSRSGLSGLVAVHGARPVMLDLLSAGEAKALLALRLDPARLAAEPEAVDDLVNACARLPLALAITAARAAARPGFPLSALATELRQARGRLDPFAGPEPATDARAVFSWSYRALSDGAARLFRLLGLHPGPDIAAPAAASLAAIPLEQTQHLLAELTHAHLIAEHKPGRYTFHDLLRAYATELAQTLPEAERRVASRRLLDHYLHTARAAAVLPTLQVEPAVVAPPQAGVIPERFVDYEQALTWFVAEHPVLLAAVEQAARSGFDSHTWQLALALQEFLDRQGHWHDLAATQTTALEAAVRSGDREGEAYTHRSLARAEANLGRGDAARIRLQEALRLYAELGDLTGQAYVHISLAFVAELVGRPSEGLSHAERAYELRLVLGDQHGQARALQQMGWACSLLRDYHRAFEHCQRALHVVKELGDRQSESAAWDSLGFIQHQLGRQRDAITCYQRAIRLRRDIGDRYREALSLTRVGDIHRTVGEPDAARNAYQQALAILDELHHPDADDVRAKLEPGPPD